MKRVVRNKNRIKSSEEGRKKNGRRERYKYFKEGEGDKV
jgi:hypothetical protein